MPFDPMLIARRVAGVFDALQIVYWIGGSVASTKYGEFRITQNIDFVAVLHPDHVPDLVAAWQSDFYVDDVMIYDAIRFEDSFNIIHLDTALKADVFIAKSDAWTQQEAARRRLTELVTGDVSTRLYIASPEDMVLQKLRRFRIGGEVSDRQWTDVQTMLKTQRYVLEYEYMTFWAGQLGLIELLNQALEAAGLADKLVLPVSIENGTARSDVGGL